MSRGQDYSPRIMVSGLNQGEEIEVFVVVGMSGGVDSSVACKILAEKGYDVSAVFMRNWDARDEAGTDKNGKGCEWEKDWADVQTVCKQIGVECKMIDLSKEYWNRVFQPALYVWENGGTPNPDVACNREIKFGALLGRIPFVAADGRLAFFATGHYARKSFVEANGLLQPRLHRAKDLIKDQSYFLSSISEKGLQRALFPLGDLLKTEVRKLAVKWGLKTAERQESMGLCFVGEKSHFADNFLSEYMVSKPGPIINIATMSYVGEHRGLWNYTIGQNAVIGGQLVKLFVSGKDATRNVLFVVPTRKVPFHHQRLYFDLFKVKNFKWLWEGGSLLRPRQAIRAKVKYRGRMSTVWASVFRSKASSSDLTVKLDTHDKGLADDQVAALYLPSTAPPSYSISTRHQQREIDEEEDLSGEWCLGCGEIHGVRNTVLRPLDLEILPGPPEPKSSRTLARSMGRKSSFTV